MKNNKGRSTGSVIIIILILILIGFLIYEIVYVDIFDIMQNNKSIIANSNYTRETNIINNEETNNFKDNKNPENIDKINPIVENDMRFWRKLSGRKILL